MPFMLTSPDFQNGATIPDDHVKNGANLSPQLEWIDPPPGTQSFVLLLDDPDAPSAPAFRHWGVFDISRDRRHLARGRSSGAGTEGLPHAVNDFGNQHYDGPRPPAGDPPHTYRFRLAALDVPTLGIGDAPDVGAMWEAARNHILGEAELIGTFGQAG